MKESEIFIVTLFVIILIGIIIQYFLWRSRRKDKEEIDSIWEKFLIAKNQNSYANMKLYGDKLVWNKYIKLKQLEELQKVIDSKKSKFSDSELDNLSINIYNKILDYKKIIPQSGSSGGNKQSW